MYLTRKSNPFHRFFNELTPVCLQCVPAQNISPLVNFTDFQLNNLHYYLSLACGWDHPLIFPYLKTPVPIFWIPPQDPPYMRTSLLRTRCCTWFVSYLEQGKPNFSLQFKSPSDPFSHFIIGGPFLMVSKVILEYEWMSSSASHSFTGPLGPYSGDTFLSPWVSQPLFELRTGCMGGNQKMLNRKCPLQWAESWMM